MLSGASRCRYSSSAASCTVVAGAPVSWRRNLVRKLSRPVSGARTNRACRSSATAAVQTAAPGVNAESSAARPASITRRAAAYSSSVGGIGSAPVWVTGAMTRRRGEWAGVRAGRHRVVGRQDQAPGAKLAERPLLDLPQHKEGVDHMLGLVAG